MVRGQPRPPRRPRRWTHALGYAVIAIGIVGALSIAMFPVHSSDHAHGVAGCGDAAAAVVLNGEGADTLVGRSGHRDTSSACYRLAEKRLLAADLLVAASFATVLVSTYVSRRAA
jgi:disulfide bond formation protein DsbB